MAITPDRVLVYEALGSSTLRERGGETQESTDSARSGLSPKANVLMT